MKSYLLYALAFLTLGAQLVSAQKVKQAETDTEFSKFLIKNIPEQYPGSSFDHHNDWFQVFIPEYDLTVSWGLTPQESWPLKDMEGLYENKTIFIAKESKNDWAQNPKIDYFEQTGYLVSEYSTATMANFDIGRLTVIHFNGRPEKFVEKMAQAYEQNPDKSELEFVYWLKAHVKELYPDQEIGYHGAWYQSVIPQHDLTVTWGTMDKPQMPIKDLHGVREDKTFFIEKTDNVDWDKHPSVDYVDETGYYLKKYIASSMGDFEVGNLCVVHFNGDAEKFVKEMAQAWRKHEPAAGKPYTPFPSDKVVVTKVKHFDNMCWKIAAAGGTWYFENGETDGKSGFSSAFDQTGNDWIGNDADRGYNKSSAKGGKHEYRGWPNFGEGNFNHPQRKSNSTSYWVDENGKKMAFSDKLEGEHLIMQTSNATYELEYHFFPTHAAIKVIKADDKYAFLFEGPVGGEQDNADFYVLKDGLKREIKSGGLGYLNPEFGNKFPSPFFYLADSDPKDTQVFYAGVKNIGPSSAGDEGWRQGDNMVIFSFGRDEDKRAYTGTEAVCVFGFFDKENHKKTSKFIEAILMKPF
ncbi:hypothetical protein [uncultured Arcticibacterium sp.]|uniref:hypothetical protein n=1 Tax=uncultured Arcticibacterium sp. TaxID=2173042 RepID=UPI0030F91F98